MTYRAVLVPAVLELAGLMRTERVIDAGCGLGLLTTLIAALTQHVIGIDPSHEQIALAEVHNRAPNVEYVTGTLESFASGCDSLFDTVIAHMTLMDVLSLRNFLAAARALLRSGGKLIATFTHPWFWPRYWGYETAPWFNYSDEIVIEAPFAISLADKPIGITTHVHRPLSAYIETLAETGFSLERLREPMPTPEVEALYPRPWVIPRYAAIRAIASTSCARPFERV